jgi:hypothetical protein
MLNLALLYPLKLDVESCSLISIKLASYVIESRHVSLVAPSSP